MDMIKHVIRNVITNAVVDVYWVYNHESAMC